MKYLIFKTLNGYKVECEKKKTAPLADYLESVGGLSIVELRFPYWDKSTGCIIISSRISKDKLEAMVTDFETVQIKSAL